MVEQYGFIVKEIDKDKTVCLNDAKLVSTMEGTNRLGTYVVGDTLHHDGIPLIKSSTEHPVLDINGVKFGEIKLDTVSKTCINITIKDYNTLLAGYAVEGYKPYNRKEVYNLVSNVSSAPIITYTEEEEGYRFGNILWKEKNNVVYNNVIGLTVSTPYNVNQEQNMLNDDHPYVDVRYFNPVIVSGNSISLKLRVSDLRDSTMNYDIIGPRYNGNTLIENGIYRILITTEDGNTVEKYTYSGVICIDTPIFSTTNNNDRQTWFKVQCIDSRGVSSIEHFLDVYVRAQPYQANYLIATDALLEEYGVTYGEENSDNESGYRNKKALSTLFQYAKDQGYNGIVLPKHDYYVDYHKNVYTEGTTPDTPPDDPPSGEVTPDIPSEPPVPEEPLTSFKFYHFSDSHGCLDAFDAADTLMEDNEDAQFTILTGDYAKDGSYGYNMETDDFSGTTNDNTKVRMRSLAHKFGYKFLVINGNHDAYDAFGSQNPGDSSVKKAAYFMHSVMENNVHWASTNTSYWYQDFPVSATAKLRIIGIDSYEYKSNHKAARYDTVYTQAQVDWFINRIEELTQEDYLLIALHEPPVTAEPIEDNPSLLPGSSVRRYRRANDFCSARIMNWSSSEYNGSLLPIIMNAYLHPTTAGTLNQTVMNVSADVAASSSVPSVKLQKTFTKAPCTFFGYLCGHIHADLCLYHPDYPDQLIMTVDCATNVSGDVNAMSDIVAADRTEGGTLINEVTLDLVNKTVSITRIGDNHARAYTVTRESKDILDPNGVGYTYPELYRDSITFPESGNTPSVLFMAVGNTNIDLGYQKYYYAVVENQKVKSYEECSLEDIERDYKGIARYPNNTAFDDINALGNATESDGLPTICYIGDDNWYSLGSYSVKYLKDNYKYLRTFKLEKDITNYTNKAIVLSSGVKYPQTLVNAELYFVYNTARGNKKEVSESDSTYRNGDNILIPDNFTVDLNGSKLIASFTYDVDKGNLLGFYKNVDSHIISSGDTKGALVGLYPRFKDYFLKSHLAMSHNIVGESMSVFKITCSKYCSIENVEITGAVGYDCCVGSEGVQGGSSRVHDTEEEILTDYIPTFINHCYIDAQGNEVKDSSVDMVTTKFQLLSGDKNVALGRSGYAGYVLCGKRYEIFASFYDSNFDYITTITSKLYSNIKIPNGATYVRFTGYGHTGSGSLASDWVAKHARGGISKTFPDFSVGCSFKDCYMHDSRTIAFGNPQGRQILYENLTFERCATDKYLGISSGGLITPVLCDFEDSWQWAKYITIKDCTYISNTDPTISSSNMFIVYNAECFDFINNTNIKLKQGGGVESGIIAGNTFSSWQIMKTRSCFHPHMEMTDNISKNTSVKATAYDSVKSKIDAVATSTGEYEEGDGDEITPAEQTDATEEDVVINVTQIDTDYDDAIEPVIAFTDSTFRTHITYDYFKLRKCLSDTVGIDYIN